jgi:hypothetical protein
MEGVGRKSLVAAGVVKQEDRLGMVRKAQVLARALQLGAKLFPIPVAIMFSSTHALGVHKSQNGAEAGEHEGGSLAL